MFLFLCKGTIFFIDMQTQVALAGVEKQQAIRLCSRLLAIYAVEKKWYFFSLLGSNEQLNGCSVEVPPFAQSVLQKAAVWLFYILGQIGEEYKGRYLSIRQLRTVFDFDVLAFGCGGRVVLYQG